MHALHVPSVHVHVPGSAPWLGAVGLSILGQSRLSQSARLTQAAVFRPPLKIHTPSTEPTEYITLPQLLLHFIGITTDHGTDRVPTVTE